MISAINQRQINNQSNFKARVRLDARRTIPEWLPRCSYGKHAQGGFLKEPRLLFKVFMKMVAPLGFLVAKNDVKIPS